jgi:16S rRNA (cytosine1402-N4)-methyltransferase
MSISQIIVEMEKEFYHYPVMHKEVIELLDIKNKKIIVDCTVGVGSHAAKFLEVAKEDVLFIGIDKDEESLKVCSQRLKSFEKKAILIKDNFSNLDTILKKLNLKGSDCFFFDLGISTYQLNNPERGFSFLREGPLDMRMDKNSFISAYDLINNLSENELVMIFKKFGEERYAKRIASMIVKKREKSPIFTTVGLAQIVLQAVPYRKGGHRIHPATRIFQALRIAVNRELENLKIGLNKAISLLNPKGRIGVISFHSLEDRIVKNIFKEFSNRGIVEILTKKPLTPSSQEREENISSRSAKLRVVQKISICG